jgi:hypothetical protein
MRIDLSQLTEPELVDLNRRIVERLRMIRQVHAHVKMLEFTIGERVWFQTDVRKVEGVLVRYNKKSVTVVTDDGERWNVAPGFLQRVPAPDSVREVGNVVQMRKAEPAK